MAKADLQKRWRANTAKRRIEAYLPVAMIDRLDTIARRRGQTRPAALASLIAAAPMPDEPTEGPEEPAAAEPEPPAATTWPHTGSQAGQASGPHEPPPYRLRRPHTDHEKRFDWIVETDEGPMCGLARKSKPGKPWRGRYLQGSLFSRSAEGDTRAEVARKLLVLPEAYQ